MSGDYGGSSGGNDIRTDLECYRPTTKREREVYDRMRYRAALTVCDMAGGVDLAGTLLRMLGLDNGLIDLRITYGRRSS